MFQTYEGYEHLTRQLDLIPIETLDTEITIIGAGAIGSFACLSLSKMGFTNLRVYDFDEVSVENMSCQWFRKKDIGKPKVQALAELIEDFTDTKIIQCNEKYIGQIHKGIVICAVDNMETRKLIWESHTKLGFATTHVIDPRMSAEYAVQYVMRPQNSKDCESYPKTLFSDSDGVQERCTAKSTMYTAQMISGLVAKAVKDIVNKKPYPRISNWNIAEDSFQSWRSEHGTNHEQAAQATV